MQRSEYQQGFQKQFAIDGSHHVLLAGHDGGVRPVLQEQPHVGLESEEAYGPAGASSSTRRGGRMLSRLRGEEECGPAVEGQVYFFDTGMGSI